MQVPILELSLGFWIWAETVYISFHIFLIANHLSFCPSFMSEQLTLPTLSTVSAPLSYISCCQFKDNYLWQLLCAWPTQCLDLGVARTEQPPGLMSCSLHLTKRLLGLSSLLTNQSLISWWDQGLWEPPGPVLPIQMVSIPKPYGQNRNE